MILIWAFPADRIYRKRLNPAERINDVRHPINLRLFNWRVVPAIGVVAQCPFKRGVGSAFHQMKIHILAFALVAASGGSVADPNFFKFCNLVKRRDYADTPPDSCELIA